MSQTFLWYWAKKNVLTYAHNQTKISGFSESPQKAFLFLPLYIIFSGLGAKPLLTGKGAEEKRGEGEWCYIMYKRSPRSNDVYFYLQNNFLSCLPRYYNLNVLNQYNKTMA